MEKQTTMYSGSIGVDIFALFVADLIVADNRLNRHNLNISAARCGQFVAIKRLCVDDVDFDAEAFAVLRFQRRTQLGNTNGSNKE